ncbi:MAG: ribosome maturation factor RimM [Spirochaetaceae bacterium]|nr:ribosome maturation factor RimM [Spirochaetaceae bacterium]
MGAPFGLKGFARLQSLSGETEHLLKLKSVFLKKNGCTQEYGIEALELQSGTLLVKFTGIDSPEEVKKLSRAEVIVDRNRAAPLQDNEFYYEDLRGLSVMRCDGAALGIITDIIEGGGGSLIAVQRTNGTVSLVPFKNEFIGEIDLEKGSAILLHEWILE